MRLAIRPSKSLQVDHPDGKGHGQEGSMGNGGVVMCVQTLALSLCGEAFPSATPYSLKHLPCAQSRARLRFRKSVFPERSLTEFRIARAVPYGTPKSLTEFLQSGFSAEIPGRKSLMEFLLTIQSRYGIDSETPIAIRIPYKIGNPPPKIIATSNREGYQSPTCQVSWEISTSSPSPTPKRAMKQTRNLLISDRMHPIDNPCTL